MIQKDIGIPIVPDPGNAGMFDMVVQSPEGANAYPERGLLDDWKVTVKKV